MKRAGRRILLSLAALSPGVAAITIHELALSALLLVLGITGALSVVVFFVAASPALGAKAPARALVAPERRSILRREAISDLRRQIPDTAGLRTHFTALLTERRPNDARFTQIALVLSQVMARWQVIAVSQLSDDQLRELWLTERLLRAGPAEAGALSRHFVAPDVMLAMRDRLAQETAG